MKIARQKFDRIKLDKTIQKPKIGIIGEFYVRWHPFSNNNMIELIEELGGEVITPTVAENLLHFNHTVIDESKRKKKNAK